MLRDGRVAAQRTNATAASTAEAPGLPKTTDCSRTEALLAFGQFTECTP